MSRPIRIGLVFDYSLAYCRGILRGIKRYAQTKESWVFTPIAPTPDATAALKRLRPAGLVAHIFSEPLAEGLVSLKTPTVNVAGILPDLRLPRVGLDDVTIGRLAAEHLIGCGLRNFAFIGHPDHAYSVRRDRGFLAHVESAGFAVQRYHERRSQFDPRGQLWALDERVRVWVLDLPKPVGVFACNDIWGVQLSELCRKAGLRVPDDVAMVGVDNDDLLCELARPSLSSVAVPAEQIGFEAAALLDRMLAGRKPPAEPKLLPPTGVVARQSSDLLAIEDAEVAAAVGWVRRNAHKPVGVKDVLREVPVSRRSLERRFRKILGRGVWEEIRRVHMERAKHLLSSSAMPMSRVAEASGFTDSKHLSVVFREETGMTPTDYRRQFRLP